MVELFLTYRFPISDAVPKFLLLKLDSVLENVYIRYLRLFTFDKMHPICEISSKYLLPIFRSRIVNILIKEHGLTQVEVAELLNISQATVSLYIGQKRGFSKKFTSSFDFDIIDQYAHSFVDEITDSSSAKTMEYFCALCNEMKRKGMLCKIHKSIGGAPSNCKICIK